MGQLPCTMSRMSAPHASDMIPALQGLSSLQVSFGSVNNISMPAADSMLGKRWANQEAQGEHCDQQANGHTDKNLGGTPKKGKIQDAWMGKPVSVRWRWCTRETRRGFKLEQSRRVN
jgi:hypothetical protein